MTNDAVFIELGANDIVTRAYPPRWRPIARWRKRRAIMAEMRELATRYAPHSDMYFWRWSK